MEAVIESAPPVTAPPDAQPSISMSFVDKVAAAGKDIAKPPAKEAPKDEKKTDAKEAPKGDSRPKETAKPADVKPADKPADKKLVDVDEGKIEWKTAPEQFRKSHEKQIAENKELRAKLQANIKADELPEYKELVAKSAATDKEYAELKKRYEEVEQTIRYVDYEKSPEFQEKFHKPWVKTYSEAFQEASQLSVQNEDGTERKITQEEFDKIVANPNLGSAISIAKSLFQDPLQSQILLGHRKEFLAVNKAMEDAKAEYRTKGAELEKQTAAQRSEQQRIEQELWTKHNKEWSEKNPQWVTVDEGDEEGSKKLELGRKAAEMAFGDTSGLEPDKRAKLYADTKNRAAAFGLEHHKRVKAEARITELEAKLKEYEESEPGKGELKPDAPVAEETFVQRLAKAAK